MIAVVATQHLAAQGQSDQIDSVSLMLYKVKGKTYSNGIIEDKLYKLRDYFNQYPTTAPKFKKYRQNRSAYIIGNTIAGGVIVGGVISALTVRETDTALYDKRLSTGIITGGSIGVLSNVFLINKIRAKRDLLESYSLLWDSDGRFTAPELKTELDRVYQTTELHAIDVSSKEEGEEVELKEQLIEQDKYVLIRHGKSRFTDGVKFGQLHEFDHIFLFDEKLKHTYLKFKDSRRRESISTLLGVTLLGASIAVVLTTNNSRERNEGTVVLGALGGITSLGIIVFGSSAYRNRKNKAKNQLLQSLGIANARKYSLKPPGTLALSIIENRMGLVYQF